MAQETPVERALRLANEKKAEDAAKTAEANANKRAEEDPKVRESRERQEQEERDAEMQARQQQAAALAAQNSANANLIGGVNPVTPNAANLPTPGQPLVASDAQAQIQAAQPVALSGVATVAPERNVGWKTYQHQYANANTIMPNGKKLIFGGQNGSTGQYSTNVPSQIEHLDDLARTPGSMVTEVRKDAEGRFIVVTDAVLQSEQQAALIDSRTNSAADLNPNVVAARSNLARQIAADS